MSAPFITPGIKAYYSENDSFCCAWLSNLMDAGHITPGKIDDRSIEDVNPDDLYGYDRCGFFAGIGVWDYALNLAGWGSRKVWHGSAPCQPFSAAGKRGGVTDERHLWPSWFHLIEQCRPSVIFGEQVEAAIKQNWLDLVQDDLEGIGYSVAPHGLAACHLGAPHIRKRLYFVADSSIADEYGRSSGWQQSIRQSGSGDVQLANTECSECRSLRIQGRSEIIQPDSSTSTVESSGNSEIGRSVALGDTNNTRLSERECDGRIQRETLDSSERQALECSSHVNGFWRDADWIYCRDEKYRPVETGTFPLAHGITNRVGKLRGYGNAIVAPVAQAFIEAFIDTRLAGAQSIVQSGRGLNREDSALGGKPLPPG